MKSWTWRVEQNGKVFAEGIAEDERDALRHLGWYAGQGPDPHASVRGFCAPIKMKEDQPNHP